MQQKAQAIPTANWESQSARSPFCAPALRLGCIAWGSAHMFQKRAGARGGPTSSKALALRILNLSTFLHLGSRTALNPKPLQGLLPPQVELSHATILLATPTKQAHTRTQRPLCHHSLPTNFQGSKSRKTWIPRNLPPGI